MTSSKKFALWWPGLTLWDCENRVSACNWNTGNLLEFSWSFWKFQLVNDRESAICNCLVWVNVPLSLTRLVVSHTHTFNGRVCGTTRVSRYQKGKTNPDFTEARDSEWQWHQLGHMQVCTSLQTDNHPSIPPLSFLQARCPSCRPTNIVKTLKANWYLALVASQSAEITRIITHCVVVVFCRSAWVNMCCRCIQTMTSRTIRHRKSTMLKKKTMVNVRPNGAWNDWSARSSSNSTRSALFVASLRDNLSVCSSVRLSLFRLILLAS